MLLYQGHRNVDSMVIEVRDWTMPEASNVLVVQTHPVATTRVRWAAGGPRPRPSEWTRRLWYERPNRLRVDVVYAGRTARSAVRDGSAWWRWDEDEGEYADDVAQGGALPPLLDPLLVYPARLLHTMWFEVTGTNNRAERNVLKATAWPREDPTGASLYFEFEFDREHGTPLSIATFDRGECTATSEVLSVDYGLQTDPATFGFHKSSDKDPLAGSAQRQRTHVGSARRPVLSRPIAPGYKTVWLTGLPGAGKTTIARATDRLLQQLGVKSCVLDGDALRQGLSSDLGLSRTSRGEHARRVAHVAALFADSGVIPIVALVSPYAADRVRAREIRSAAGVGFVGLRG
jgi:hypothetical protein